MRFLGTVDVLQRGFEVCKGLQSRFFRSLSDTYHHDLEKHGHVFEAVSVTVQYQMDMVSKLFDA